MSKNAYPQVDDKMTKVDVPSDVPNGDVQDSSYVSRSGQKDPIPVQRDDAPVKDNIDPAIADTDEQLERDDKEAIDESNILDGRTRNAKPKGGYREPSDEEMGLME